MRTLKENVKNKKVGQRAEDRTLGKACIYVENFRTELESLKSCENSMWSPETKFCIPLSSGTHRVGILVCAEKWENPPALMIPSPTGNLRKWWRDHRGNNTPDLTMG